MKYVFNFLGLLVLYALILIISLAAWKDYFLGLGCAYVIITALSTAILMCHIEKHPHS